MRSLRVTMASFQVAVVDEYCLSLVCKHSDTNAALLPIPLPYVVEQCQEAQNGDGDMNAHRQDFEMTVFVHGFSLPTKFVANHGAMAISVAPKHDRGVFVHFNERYLLVFGYALDQLNVNTRTAP